jgi:uncharacterized membrane protein
MFTFGVVNDFSRVSLKIGKIFALTLLAIFSLLMVRITLPYLSLEYDVKFLKIKQWVIDNDIWRNAFFIHVFSSTFLLIAGFTQFSSSLKNKYPFVHRRVGKVYVFIILFLSGPAGFIMAIYANGGFTSQLAFGILSLLWIYCTAMAWITARRKDFKTHGEWMIRSYALTLSALTLRAWKLLIVILFHIHPMDGYRIVAWLGWIPNILIAEWLIGRAESKRLKVKS